MKRFYLGALVALFATGAFCLPVNAKTIERGEFNRPYFIDGVDDYIYDSPEQIAEEIKLGEMEMISQLVEAEAGNQDLYGKRLVVSVILNRLHNGNFGSSIEDIIFEDEPLQFSVTKNGRYDKAGYHMQKSDYVAVSLEFTEGQVNKDVLYFNCGDYVEGTTPLFKYGDHYFSK